jgi:hypothetical protein
MEPATPSKRVKKRRTEKYKRFYLGEKGIGRFAASRLAEELELISRKKNIPTESYGILDWRQFDDEKKYLDEILILWDERAPKEIKPGGAIDLLWKNEKELPTPSHRDHGTILIMTGLKQKWEIQHFEGLQRNLARMVLPKYSRKNEDDKDPGFEVELSLPDEFSQFSSKVSPPQILKHPHYSVKGKVTAEGSYEISYKIVADGNFVSTKGRFLRVKDSMGRFELREIDAAKFDNLPTDIRFIECGPIELDIRVWDRDDLGNIVQKTQSTIKDIRTDLDAVAGINIYRDGFRVLPYGEPNDDWLRLDLRRVQKPTMRLSNNQIYGVIYISSEANPKLRDQSNREGLDENQAVIDLREILILVLNQLEGMRYDARPRNTVKNSKPIGGLFAGFDFKPLADYVAKHLPQNQEAQDLVERTDKLFGGQLKEIQTVLGRYQRLATLGQLIDHVLHEGRQPISTINSETALGLNDINSVRPKTPFAGNKKLG